MAETPPNTPQCAHIAAQQVEQSNWTLDSPQRHRIPYQANLPPNSLGFSFNMGVHSPLSHTFTSLNHNSALLYPDQVLSHIHKELSLCRYSGPFSCSRLEFLIGPFQTSPLSSVPQSHGSTECRIVQDLSFPRNDPTQSSINDQINIKDFRHLWLTVLLTITQPRSTDHCAQYRGFYYNVIVIHCQSYCE